MMWKKLFDKVLFPHIAILIILLPTAAVLLAYAVLAEANDIVVYGSYVLSAYTLTVWCVRVLRIIRFCRSFKKENKYARLWFGDERLRVNVSLGISFVWNAAYSFLQLWLGWKNDSLWYYSLAIYYILLASMRFFLAAHTRKFRAGEQMRAELMRYRACGIIFLIMNVAISVMIFYMAYLNRSEDHGEIITIAMAAYTFTTFFIAICNIVRYGRYNSPVYSASKAISFAAACVSMLTLESSMLNTFNKEQTSDVMRKIFLMSSGIAVSTFIITMAIYMIITGTKKLKLLKAKELADGKQE